MEAHLDHPTLDELAEWFSEDPPAAEKFGRHLAATCPSCAEQLRKLEALIQRFGHWDPAVAVREGLAADGLLAALLEAGTGFESWEKEIEARDEFQTWGVAWVALERAREILAAEAPQSQAHDLACLAAAIAERLGDTYHVEFVQDLKALAYAPVAAAAEGPPEGYKDSRLKQVGAAVTALAEGTGSESTAKEVWSLLSRLFR